MTSKPRKTPAVADQVATAAPAKKVAKQEPQMSAKTAASAKAPAKTAAPAENSAFGGKGRAPHDGKYTINAENLVRIKRGFTFEFLGKAQEMNKAGRGKGFLLSDLFAEFPDKSRGQLMDCFYACTGRGVFVAA